MREVTFTFQVNESLKDQFIAAAKGCDRTTEQLLRQFMSDFVRRQQQEEGGPGQRLVREGPAGVDPAKSGEVSAAEELNAEPGGRREETRQKMDGSDS
jgi:predicted transcriptional regulator